MIGMTAEQERRIAEQYREGVTVREIMDEHGIGTSRLYKALANQGVKPYRKPIGPPRRRPIVSATVERMMIERRMNYAELAELIRYSHEYTYFVLTGYHRMTAQFAYKVGRRTGLDGDQILREAEEWHEKHGGDEKWQLRSCGLCSTARRARKRTASRY